MNQDRQKAIELLNEIQDKIAEIEQELANQINPLSNTQILERLGQVKIKKLCIESQIAVSLPIELEGFLGEDTGDEVDRDEFGIIREINYYIGCPIFPNERPRHYGTVGYEKFKDLTEILQHNTGNFLRVTIEAIPLGETEKCQKCDKRFQCITTKVIG